MYQFLELKDSQNGSDQTIEFVGDIEPMRAVMFQRPDLDSVGLRLDLESSRGTWYDNQTTFPEPWKGAFTATGEDWGILEIGSGNFAIAKHDSDTSFTSVGWLPGLRQMFGDDNQPITPGIHIIPAHFTKETGQQAIMM